MKVIVKPFVVIHELLNYAKENKLEVSRDEIIEASKPYSADGTVRVILLPFNAYLYSTPLNTLFRKVYEDNVEMFEKLQMYLYIEM